MYAIHTTPGFIIDSRPRGEAGKLLSIFTRDFGLIYASAQGIRLEKSKLRYYTQDYAMGTYSLVRGKEFWRLTSAAGEANMLSDDICKSDKEVVIFAYAAGQQLVARLALLLRRLLQGEEPNQGLFDIVQSAIDFLCTNPDLDDVQLKSLESVTVLRCLHALGYVGKDSILKDCLESTDLSVTLLVELAPRRALMNQHINKALKESHL